MWLGFSLLYLRQNIKPYTSNQASAELKILQKKIYTSFDWSSLIFNWSSLIFNWSNQVDLHSKSCRTLDSNFTYKHTLSKSKTRLKTFWSWFANIRNWSFNTLVPNSLEPNNIDYLSWRRAYETICYCIRVLLMGALRVFVNIPFEEIFNTIFMWNIKSSKKNSFTFFFSHKNVS